MGRKHYWQAQVARQHILADQYRVASYAKNAAPSFKVK